MLDEKLLEQVLTRFGLSGAPGQGVDGLHAVYAAWCLSVPFDNIAKLIALRSGSDAALPGLDATEFYHRLLDHGTSGTCWPSSNALFELVDALGFDARRVAGSMRDTGIVSHGSVTVRVSDNDWLLDSSMLTMSPLPLTDELYISDDKRFPAEVEYTEGKHVIWCDLPPNPTLIPCPILVDPATHDFYAECYEASRLRSPFNERLYAKRIRADEKLVLIGNTRISKTADALKTEDLDASQLCEALRDEIGISGELIEVWRGSGALEASFKAPSGPSPAAITTRSPSQRVGALTSKIEPPVPSPPDRPSRS